MASIPIVRTRRQRKSSRQTGRQMDDLAASSRNELAGGCILVKRNGVTIALAIRKLLSVVLDLYPWIKAYDVWLRPVRTNLSAST